MIAEEDVINIDLIEADINSLINKFLLEYSKKYGLSDKRILNEALMDYFIKNGEYELAIMIIKEIIIRSDSKQKSTGISIIEITKKASELGISKKYAQMIIKKLKKNNILHIPQNRYVSLI